MYKIYHSVRKNVSVLLSLIIICFSVFTSSIFAVDSPQVFHPKQPFPPAMQQFINHMVDQYQFNRAQLNYFMSQADILPVVVHSVEKPMETAVTWDKYRQFFLSPERISGGVNYWQQHQKTLATAQKQYGVDPSVIVAIIGVETLYGSEKERYQVLGALTTLAFYHQARSAFFEKELEQFFLLTRQFQLPVLSLRGSYAGAMGIPQFMPSSYRRFAVSYTNNPHIDLLNNHDDAIMSIANYLYRSGWQANQPVALPAQITHNNPPEWLISKTANSDYRMATLAKFGVTSFEKLSPAQKTALIAMQDTRNREYWLVFPNFSAIMSYNPRTSYALAVYQLSQIIRNQYAQQQTSRSRTTVAER